MTKVKYTLKNFEIPTEGVHDAELIEIKELVMVDTPNGRGKRSDSYMDSMTPTVGASLCWSSRLSISHCTPSPACRRPSST